MNPSDGARERERISDVAAGWVLRRDRGLSAAEEDEFSRWLAADERHGAALAAHRRNWERLDQLIFRKPEHGRGPDRDLLAPAPSSLLKRGRGFRGLGLVFPLAAAIALGLYVFGPRRAGPASDPPVRLSTIEERTLADGSIIELNRGARVSVAYSLSERRVRLERGEAHFKVAKNPARPFIVSAGGVDVRAVGTAFDVRLDPTAVAILVTEGRVRVNPPPSSSHAPAAEPTALEAGQRAVVSLEPAAPPPRIVAVSASEMDAILLWQPRLLDFVREPLAGVAAEFNRRNPVQIIVADPDLASIPMSASLRSDNVEGFVRLLEAGFGVQAERRGNTIVLRKPR